MKRYRPHYLRMVIVAACVAGLTAQANTHAATGAIYFPRAPYAAPGQLAHPVCWADPADPWAVTWKDGTPREVPCP